MPPTTSGLRDIEVLESSITAITPEGLFLRGIALEELLEQASFEEVAFLLWMGRAPNPSEQQGLRRVLARAWLLPQQVIDIVAQFSKVEPLVALQTALPLLAVEDTEENVIERRAARILAQMPAVLALQRQGQPAPPLDVNRHFAEQVLTALGARPLPPGDADRALILYADHELAASTFAARIAAAALANLYDGMSAALAVLKGALHGGSIPEVAQMLRGLAEAPALEQAIDALLQVQPRLPGFGHSVYKAGDPRAGHFRTLASRIVDDESRRWLEAAEQLERAVRSARGLQSNVDLYAAVWMHAAGIEDRMMPGLFAVARTAGWTTHMLEQQSNNRLIRPRARYTGSVDRRWPR